jgi:hypothetical protein
VELRLRHALPKPCSAQHLLALPAYLPHDGSMLREFSDKDDRDGPDPLWLKVLLLTLMVLGTVAIVGSALIGLVGWFSA